MTTPERRIPLIDGYLKIPGSPPLDSSSQPIDTEAVRRRVEAATPGPWTAHDDGLVWPERMGDPVSGSTELADAEFIAHARSDVPALLAALEEARRERDELLTKARAWRDARADQQCRGMDFHRACVVLAAAVDSYEKTQESTE